MKPRNAAPPEQFEEFQASVLFCGRCKEPRPVRELRPEIPEALGQLIGRMLIKDPGQRIADAMETRSRAKTFQFNVAFAREFALD